MVALSSGLLDTERYVVCYPMRSARCRKRAHCCCSGSCVLDTQTCLILGQTCSKRQAPIGQPDVLQPFEATEGGGRAGARRASCWRSWPRRRACRSPSARRAAGRRCAACRAARSSASPRTWCSWWSASPEIIACIAACISQLGLLTGAVLEQGYALQARGAERRQRAGLQGGQLLQGWRNWPLSCLLGTRLHRACCWHSVCWRGHTQPDAWGGASACLGRCRHACLHEAEDRSAQSVLSACMRGPSSLCCFSKRSASDRTPLFSDPLCSAGTKGKGKGSCCRGTRACACGRSKGSAQRQGVAHLLW